MKEIAVYEAKTRFSELLVEVEQGAQFVITRRGHAVARLTGAAPAKRGAASQRQRVLIASQALRELRKGVSLEGDLQTLIAEGRD